MPNTSPDNLVMSVEDLREVVVSELHAALLSEKAAPSPASSKKKAKKKGTTATTSKKKKVSSFSDLASTLENVLSSSLSVDGRPVNNQTANALLGTVNRSVANKIKKAKPGNTAYWVGYAIDDMIDSLARDGHAKQRMFSAKDFTSLLVASLTDKIQKQSHYAKLDARSFGKNANKNFDRIYQTMASEYVSMFAKEVKRLATKVGIELDSNESPKLPLGKYAFAGERRTPDVPIEPNTPLEDELYGAISGHFRDSEPIDKDDASKIKSFLKKGAYEDVFNEPKVKVVYRGMGVPISYIQKLTGKSVKDLHKTKSGKGSVKKRMQFVPRKGSSSSWSEDYEVAENFGFDNKDRDDGPPAFIVMHAKLSDNRDVFAAGKGGLYKLRASDSFHDEKEATALSTVKVSQVDWFVDPDAYDDYDSSDSYGEDY